MNAMKKGFTRMMLTMTLLFAGLVFPSLTGQAASGNYQQYSFVHKGSTSELYTKNYSVYQIAGGFKVVRKGKTVGTIKGKLGNILYSNKDFYYSTYTGTSKTFKFTVCRMTPAGKSSRIASFKTKGLLELDAVYNGKLYGHCSQYNDSNGKYTNYVYRIGMKNHKAAQLCSFGGELGYIRGVEQSPVLSGGVLLFAAGEKAVAVDLASGNIQTLSENLKLGLGDVDTSIWKDGGTFYLEQEDAIKKFNNTTNTFEEDASLGEYAQNYSVIYANAEAVFYRDDQNVCLYMRRTGVKTKLGKDVFSGNPNGVHYIDGPVAKGNNLYFIVSKINKCEIWKVSLQSGMAKKVKTCAQDLRFRSDGKKIGYEKNYKIKYVYTLK